VQNERLIRFYFHQFRQVRHFLPYIHIGMSSISEQTELPVQVQINASGLNRPFIEGVYYDSIASDFLFYGSVAQYQIDSFM
jgi:hypothetical protein